MKIIFLDIDGVLNNKLTFLRLLKKINNNETYSLEIEEDMLKKLRKLVHRTGAKIVLSSSWKNHFMKKDNKIMPIDKFGEKIIFLFRLYGIEIFDLTPSILNDRWLEIASWIISSKSLSSFVIIDDLKCTLPVFDKFFVLTDFNIGLTDNDIERAIKILKSGETRKNTNKLKKTR